jgi:ferredoxin
MTYVVTDNCRLCRTTDCVEVCPVDCFHGDDEMLYIDPGVCIDCGACVPECPVEAIYDQDELPADQARWLELNAQRAPKLPTVKRRQPPHPMYAQRKKELGF